MEINMCLKSIPHVNIFLNHGQMNKAEHAISFIYTSLREYLHYFATHQAECSPAVMFGGILPFTAFLEQ